MFPSKSNLLKSPLQLIFMDGRTLESQRERERAALALIRDEHGMKGGRPTKSFPTFVYDVVVHQKIRSGAQLDSDSRQLDRHKT